MRVKITSNGLHTKITDMDLNHLIRGVQVVEWRHDAADMANPQVTLVGRTDADMEVVGDVADMPELERLTLDHIVREVRQILASVKDGKPVDYGALEDGLATWDLIRGEMSIAND